MAIRLLATAGPAEGQGHLARALALAEALVELDLAVSLELLRGEPTDRQAERLAELGVALGGRPVEAAVVVDLPDPNEGARDVAPDRLVVFDDRERFAGEACLVVQASLPRWSGRGRAAAVLEGYAYAPLARAVRDLRVRATEAPRRPPRVLVCFGGSDPDRVTARIAGALSGEGRWKLEVIVGARYHGSTEAWPVVPLRDPPDFAARLAACDLAVIGSGTMKFEAACLGRPAILLAAADDQRPTGPPFAATGAALYLGDGRSIDPAEVRVAVERLVADGAARARMGERARAVVDGEGSARVARAIAALVCPGE